MKAQVCEPCAKRKVRCDRAEPSCSNCKRRKHDRCVYPDNSLHERIKCLETVQFLSESPSSDQLGDITPATFSNAGDKSRDTTSESIPAEMPFIMREGDSTIYAESKGWESWNHGARLYDVTAPSEITCAARSIFFPEKHFPHAFQGISWIQGQSLSVSSADECPIPERDATKLWKSFMQRVEPITRISFEWTLHQLEKALLTPELWRRLSKGEQSLILSMCLFGVVSLSNEECINAFGQPKSSMLSRCRTHCECALSRSELLAIDDVSTLKALCLYMKASIDTVTAHSLWSLMGLVSRSAEQLGIHRDGELLRLSPAETEERRRLWWQLQHLELVLAFKRGVTSISFTAQCDAKLPLNIEDCHISVASKTMPKERCGLTTMSYTLLVYYVVDQQRNIRRKRPGQPSTIDQSVLGPLTNAMIDDIEAGLNKKFLQYCDLIKPLDLLIQITARLHVCLLRSRSLHETRLDSNRLDKASHGQTFDTALQCLKYCITGYSQPTLLPFRWLLDMMLSWQALIGVLVDIPQVTDVGKVETAWAVLSELYAAMPFLMDLSGDRRRAHAASSIVTTWNACKQKLSFNDIEKPTFVSALEDRISRFGKSNDDLVVKEMDKPAMGTVEPPEFEFWPGGSIATVPFNFNYADIDWSFWESIN